MGDQTMYQNLLDKLSENISNDELTSLVAACQDVLSSTDRSRVKEHRDLFSQLEKANKLGKDNCNYLEHALEKICRPDLVIQMLDYREKVMGKKEELEKFQGPSSKYKGENINTHLPDLESQFAKIKLAPPPSPLDKNRKA